MVVHGNREELLGLVLSDDVLVEILLNLGRLGHVGKLYVKLAAVLALVAVGSEPGFNHNLVCLLCTLVADKAVESGYNKVDILL